MGVKYLQIINLYLTKNINLRKIINPFSLGYSPRPFQAVQSMSPKSTVPIHRKKIESTGASVLTSCTPPTQFSSFHLSDPFLSTFQMLPSTNPDKRPNKKKKDALVLHVLRNRVDNKNRTKTERDARPYQIQLIEIESRIRRTKIIKKKPPIPQHAAKRANPAQGHRFLLSLSLSSLLSLDFPFLTLSVTCRIIGRRSLSFRPSSPSWPNLNRRS